MRSWTRREFLALSTGSLFLLTGGGVLVRVLGESTQISTKTRSAPSPRPNKFFPSGAPTVLPFPIWTTRNEDFYTVKYDEVPSISLNTWSLTLHGLVREQLRLTYDEIRSLPSVTTMHTLECIGNPVGGDLIGNANWRGVPLRALLERAGVDSRTQWVVIGGVDDYFTSLPIATVMHDHAMLAYEMNGEVLPLGHGYPLRAILPGVYGQKQPKWVTGIKLTDVEELGPWEQKGWSRQATVRTNSAFKSPMDAEQLSRGDILIAGVAHAGVTGIKSVQVSADGGKNWNETVLTRGPSQYVWTQWGYLWQNPSPGKYTLLVRASDNSGEMQDEASTGILGDEFPDGTSAIHSIHVEIREL